jgi:exonuclease SbcC
MRIRTVRIKNFNALKGEHTIDFEHTSLASSGLYVITGPTGSGKSTILDAITLALFGLVPRISASKITKTDIEGSGIILTKHTSDCLAEVVYEVEGMSYRSSWTIGKNSKGKLNERKQELCFHDSGEIITSKYQDVISKNQEIIGLNYAQFMQSVLLAQGQFARLLQSSRTDRNRLLETITGTGMYRTIGKKAFERYARANEAVKAKQNFMHGMTVRTPEDIEHIRNQIADNEPIRVSLETAFNKWIALRNTKDALQKIALEKASNKENWQKWQVSEQEFSIESIKLRRHIELLPLLPGLTALKNQFQNHQRLQKELDQLSNQLEQLQTQRNKLLTEANALLSKPTTEGDLKTDLESLRNTYREHKEQLKDAHKEYRSQMNFIENEKSQLDKLTKIPLPDVPSIHFCEELFVKTKERLWYLQPQLEALSGNTIESLNEKLAKVGNLVSKAELLEERIESFDKLTKEIERDESQLKEWEHLLPDGLEKIRLAKKSLVKAKEELERKQKEHGLSAYRQDLVEGEPCPLCGSIEHPLNEVISDDLLAVLQQVVHQHESSVESVEGQHNEHLSKIQTLINTIDFKKNELEGKANSINETKNQMSELCQSENWGLQFQSDVWKIKESSIRNDIDSLKEQEILTNLLLVLDGMISRLSQYEQLRLHIETVSESIQNLSKGKDIEKEVESFFEKWSENHALSEEKMRRLQESRAEEESLSNDLKRQELDLLKASQPFEVETITELSSHFLTEQEFHDYTAKEKALSNRREVLTAEKERLQNEYDQLTGIDDASISIDACRMKVEEFKDEVKAISEQIGAWTQELQRAEEQQVRYAEAMNELQALKTEQRRWHRMNELIGESTGNRFANFVQDLLFSRLLHYGNERLRSFSDRYLLALPETSNQDYLQVIDTYMGHSRRSVISLSGGETFKLSLGLALGLSDLAAGKVNIESIFIDEGFGSLDPDSLDEAISLLESIQQTGQKSIGIISHVSELKERIGAKVKLVPVGSGYSKIEIE